jgi:hypothetical protein
LPPFRTRAPVLTCRAARCALPSFGAQAAVLLGVVFPPEQLDSLGVALGVAAIGGGAAFAVAGVLGLGDSLSPFPVPSRSNVLVQDGVYAQVRHPMYTGLLLASFGAALASGSPARLLFCAALVAVLSTKMDVEEAALQARHARAAMLFLSAADMMRRALHGTRSCTRDTPNTRRARRASCPSCLS